MSYDEAVRQCYNSLCNSKALYKQKKKKAGVSIVSRDVVVINIETYIKYNNHSYDIALDLSSSLTINDDIESTNSKVSSYRCNMNTTTNTDFDRYAFRLKFLRQFSFHHINHEAENLTTHSSSFQYRRCWVHISDRLRRILQQQDNFRKTFDSFLFHLWSTYSGSRLSSLPIDTHSPLHILLIEVFFFASATFSMMNSSSSLV